MRSRHLAFLALLTASLANAAQLPNAPHIATTGNATVTVRPDIALLSFETSHSAGEPQQAKQLVDKAVNTLLAGITQFKVEAGDISSSDLSLDQDIRYDANDNPLREGYIASRNIKVYLKDTSQISDLIDFALQSGVSELNNISMKSSRESELKIEAQTQAVEHAKEQAANLASNLGVKLGEIYSIIPESTKLHGQYRNVERIEVTGSSLRKPQYLQPQIEFSAEVELVFLLDSQ